MNDGTLVLSPMHAEHTCLSSSIELLLEIMRKPDSPEICFLRVTKAIDCVTEEFRQDRRTNSSIIKFARSQSELIRAAIHFLTRCRTVTQHQSMVDDFPRCRCNLLEENMQLLHRPCTLLLSRDYLGNLMGVIFDAGNGPEHAIANLANEMVNFIQNALILTLPNKLRFYAEKDACKASNGDVSCWPQDMRDFLPFGIEHSIHALHHWVTQSPTTLAVLGFKLAFVLALAHDGFGQELSRLLGNEFKYDIVFILPFRHIGALLKEYQKDLEDAERLGISLPPPDQAATKHLPDSAQLVAERVRTFCEDVLHSYRIFELAKMRCGNLVALVSMIYSNDDMLKPILDRLSVVVQRAREDTEFGQMKRAVTLLEMNSPRYITFNKQTGEINYKNTDERDKRMSTAVNLRSTWTMIAQVRHMGCMAPECPLPVADSMRARLCSGCDTIRFCDKACQTKAWKHPEHPHKKLCAKLGALRKALGPEIWIKFMEKHEIRVGLQFRDVCKEKNVSEYSIFEIGSEILALKSIQDSRRTTSS